MTFLDKVVIKSGYEEDNFVGLRYKKEKVYLYLPLGYEKSVFNTEKDLSNEQKADLLLLLKTVNLVKISAVDYTEFGNDIGGNDEIPYNSFLWIISDYFNNGLYQEIEKINSQKSKGKINWKKTINSEHYFSDNSVVYINPYYNSNVQKNNLITELNNYCLHKSMEYIGFLFGNIRLPECNISSEFIKSKNKHFIDVINKELVNSFNDRKKLLLMNMKRIIEMTFNDNEYNQISYGTRKFEYAWEKMVNANLGSKIDISKYFPNAYWNIMGKVENDKSKLRPDTILIDKMENKIYIIDAKYYKYGITGNISDLPHTDSIQKQITYGDHISNNYDEYRFDKNNIYNAFILPFNKTSKPFLCEENIKYLGFANSAWRDKKHNYNYEKISLLLVDTKYMIDCFYKKEKADIMDLIKKIERSSQE